MDSRALPLQSAVFGEADLKVRVKKLERTLGNSN